LFGIAKIAKLLLINQYSERELERLIFVPEHACLPTLVNLAQMTNHFSLLLPELSQSNKLVKNITLFPKLSTVTKQLIMWN
jgi:hypothetical protein